MHSIQYVHRCPAGLAAGLLACVSIFAHCRPVCCAETIDLTGVWYTAGTVAGYAASRPDPSVAPEYYACVYPGKDTVYSGPMATYCSWTRSMATYVPSQDKTYFVYGNANNSPTISYYDHTSGLIASPVVLGSNPDGDAHRNPTLLVDDDGYLYSFYGAHGGVSQVVKSVSPYDITEWTDAADITTTNTYPQPWQLKNDELFLSYRSSAGWTYQKSTDGAASWQTPTTLISFPGKSIYLASIADTADLADGPRRIHMAWSEMGGGTEEEIRTKALWARRYDVYYAYSDDGGSTWKNSQGTPYTLPIGPTAADQVHESGENGVWIKDIQLDSQGNPYVLFIDCDVRTYEATWKFARVTGGDWEVHDVTVGDNMYDDGGMVIIDDNDFRIYAPTTAVQDHEDGGAIEEWTSNDRGATWTNTKHLTPDSVLSHNNVKAVYNHQKDDFSVMWSYGDSQYPPPTGKDVYMYRYGEGMSSPQRMSSVFEPQQLRNGDFEAATFDRYWTNGNDAATVHRGLTAAGLDESGTQAALMHKVIANASDALLQTDLNVGSRWQLDFLFASGEIAAGGSRSLNFTVNGEGSGYLNIRLDPNGKLYAYSSRDASWHQISTDTVSFSHDGNGDGDFEDGDDALCVHSLRIFGNYACDSPYYNVYLSDANSAELDLVAANVRYWQSGVPVSGEYVDQIRFASGASDGLYLVDEVSFAAAPWIPGDANGDAFVNSADAAMLAANWQKQSDATWAEGDFSGDGKVNDVDASLMAANWMSDASGTVPEPSILLLSAIGSMIITLYYFSPLRDI